MVHCLLPLRALTRRLRLQLAQAPEAGPEAQLFEGVRGIMQASAQSLRLTRLSGRRDMSTLLAQSAFSVRRSLLLAQPPELAVVLHKQGISSRGLCMRRPSCDCIKPVPRCMHQGQSAWCHLHPAMSCHQGFVFKHGAEHSGMRLQASRAACMCARAAGRGERVLQHRAADAQRRGVLRARVPAAPGPALPRGAPPAPALFMPAPAPFTSAPALVMPAPAPFPCTAVLCSATSTRDSVSPYMLCSPALTSCHDSSWCMAAPGPCTLLAAVACIDSQPLILPCSLLLIPPIFSRPAAGPAPL